MWSRIARAHGSSPHVWRCPFGSFASLIPRAGRRRDPRQWLRHAWICFSISQSKEGSIVASYAVDNIGPFFSALSAFPVIFYSRAALQVQPLVPSLQLSRRIGKCIVDYNGRFSSCRKTDIAAVRSFIEYYLMSYQDSRLHQARW